MVIFLRKVYTLRAIMADVAQLVRALGCGPKGRRFNSGRSPHCCWTPPIFTSHHPFSLRRSLWNFLTFNTHPRASERGHSPSPTPYISTCHWVWGCRAACVGEENGCGVQKKCTREKRPQRSSPTDWDHGLFWSLASFMRLEENPSISRFMGHHPP